MSSFNWPSQVQQAVPTVPNQASLPPMGLYDGQLYLTTDNDSLYAWNLMSMAWVLLNSASTVTGSGITADIAIWAGSSTLGVTTTSSISRLPGSLILDDGAGSGNIQRPDGAGNAFSVGNGVNASFGEFDFKNAAGSATNGSVTDSGLWTLGASGGTQPHVLNGSLNIIPGSGADLTAINVYAGTTTGTVRTYWRNINATRSFEFDADFSSGTENLLIQSDSTTIAQFTRPGQFRMVIDGNASAPAFSFSNSPAMGLYRHGTDILGFATAGTTQGTISALGLWTLGASGGTQTHVVNGNLSITGTLSVATQAANKVYAGPTSGSAAAPTFRSLVANDIPSLSGIYLPLSGGTLTGALTLIAGSVATPSINVSDSDTGLYRSGSHEISVSAAGVQSLRISQAQVALPIFAYMNIPGTAAQNNIFATGSSSDTLTLSGDVTSNVGGQIKLFSRGASPANAIQFINTSGVNGSLDGTGAWTLGASGGIRTHTINGNLLVVGGGGLSVFERPDNTGVAFQLGNGTNTSYGVFEFRNTSGVTLDGSVNNSGLWTLGASGGTQTHVVNGNLSVSGSLTAAWVAPTIQTFTSGSGTYTLPSGPVPLYIRVRLVGAGGGGGGGATGGSGSAGGNTTFGTTLLVGDGGGGGGVGTTTTLGSGGTASLGTGPVGIALTGGTGSLAGTALSNGASGATSPFGGGASGSAPGAAAATSTVPGSGGGGSGSGGGGGNGGGAGGYIDAIITSPTSTYAYVVGTGGAGGTAPAGGGAGGAGAPGIIIVEEFYQ